MVTRSPGNLDAYSVCVRSRCAERPISRPISLSHFFQLTIPPPISCGTLQLIYISLSSSTAVPAMSAGMINTEGLNVDLYIPRKCAAGTLDSRRRPTPGGSSPPPHRHASLAPLDPWLSTAAAAHPVRRAVLRMAPGVFRRC